SSRRATVSLLDTLAAAARVCHASTPTAAMMTDVITDVTRRSAVRLSARHARSRMRLTGDDAAAELTTGADEKATEHAPGSWRRVRYGYRSRGCDVPR